MFKFLFLFLISFNAYAQGDLSGALKPQSSTSKYLFGNLEVPNNQGTKTGAVNALIETGNKNLLSNPSFEHSTFTTSWTISGTGAGNEVPETSIVQSGKKSLEVALTSETYKLCAESSINALNFEGQDMVASIWVKGDAADGKVCPYANGNEITSLCVNISSLDKWDEYVVIFPGGNTTNGLCVEYTSTTGTVYVDDAHVGVMPATMTPEVAQAEYFGSARLAGATNCIWDQAATSFTSFPADADCSNWTAEGDIKASASKTPSFIIPAGSPSGSYIVHLNLGLTAANGDGIAGYYRLHNGSSQVGDTIQVYGTSSFDISISPYYFRFDYTTQSTDTTYTIQSRSASGQTAIRGCNITDRSCVFDVYYYPPKNKIYSNKSMGWYVDVNIGGANPSLGTSSVSSYTSISNGSLDMVINPGSQTAQIPCSTTNPSTGLTCSAGDEQIGVVFDIPSVGTYEVCGEFSHYGEVLSNSLVNPNFQWVETANTSQTIIQEGKSRPGSTILTASSNALLYSPYNLCGVFNFTSIGKKTLRLAYEQGVSGTVSASQVIADRSAAAGQRDIHITVKPFINNEQITASFKQIDDELEEVYVYAHSSSTTIGTSLTDVTWNTEVSDNKNAFNPSTGVFTAPRDGLYVFSSNIYLNSTNLSTSDRFASTITNSANTELYGCQRANGVGVSQAFSSVCNATIRLSQGATLKLRAVSSVSNALSNTQAGTYLTITRIPSK